MSLVLVLMLGADHVMTFSTKNSLDLVQHILLAEEAVPGAFYPPEVRIMLLVNDIVGEASLIRTQCSRGPGKLADLSANQFLMRERAILDEAEKTTVAP